MSLGMDGARVSLGELRQYLIGLAQARLGGRYSAKLDPSDLVQQTLLNALENLHQFRGSSEKECAAWLREIFVHNLADVFRSLNRQCRDVARERSCDRLGKLEESFPAEHVDNDEQLLRLAWALSELPELQHVAVELHHLQGLSLAETAKQLNRTEASAAGLVRRGLERLRELLQDASGDH